MRRTGILMTGCLVAAYLAMAIFSAACAIEHDTATPAGHHSHHGNHGIHTMFCAWACQANQTVDLLATAPQRQPLHLIAFLLLVGLSTPSLFAQHAASSRAPPQR